MPRQDTSRVLAYGLGENYAVLVIDDASDLYRVSLGMRVASMLLDGIDHTYTRSVRCEHEEDYPFTEEELATSVACCATWTNSLLEGRKFIITTLWGARQMKMTSFVKEGDLCLDGRYGYVLIVPPLHTFVQSDGVKLHKEAFTTYKAKVWRVLKKEKSHAK